MVLVGEKNLNKFRVQLFVNTRVFQKKSCLISIQNQHNSLFEILATALNHDKNRLTLIHVYLSCLFSVPGLPSCSELSLVEKSCRERSSISLIRHKSTAKNVPIANFKWLPIRPSKPAFCHSDSQSHSGSTKLAGNDKMQGNCVSRLTVLLHM